MVSTAPGSQNRELRVEGRRDGHTGYWSKMIDAKTWTFVPTDQSLKGKSLDNPQRDTSKVGLGSASGVHYSGSLQGAATIDIKDFAYQSTTRTVDLKISGKTYPVKLHSIDGRLKTAISMLSPRKRGLTDTPRYYDAAIEVPDSYLEDPNFSSFMKGYMRGEKVHEVYLVVTKDSFKVINDRHPGIALRLGRNVSILHRVK